MLFFFHNNPAAPTSRRRGVTCHTVDIVIIVIAEQYIIAYSRYLQYYCLKTRCITWLRIGTSSSYIINRDVSQQLYEIVVFTEKISPVTDDNNIIEYVLFSTGLGFGQ